jgi:hypothetical protein
MPSFRVLFRKTRTLIVKSCLHSVYRTSPFNIKTKQPGELFRLFILSQKAINCQIFGLFGQTRRVRLFAGASLVRSPGLGTIGSGEVLPAMAPFALEAADPFLKPGLPELESQN